MRDVGFEPQFTEVIFNQTNRNTHACVFLPLLIILAGCESLTWHPLVSDFILVAKKIKKLGFVYNEGRVFIVGPEIYENE